MNPSSRFLSVPILLSLAIVLVSCTETQQGPPVDQTPGAEDPKEQNFASSAGDYAGDFLTDAIFDELIVEVDYIEGFPPSPAALTALEAKLEELCRKPDGVQVSMDDKLQSSGSQEWTLREIEITELSHRNQYRDPGTGVAVMYVLYLDGNWEGDTGNSTVLGIAYRGSSCVMFAESIDDVDPGLPLFAEIEDTVLLHEAGHLLGLVNNGIDMVQDHADPQHPAHDVSDECIMYWQVETQDVVDVLLDRSPDFDSECRADMIAAGGKP